MLAYANELHTTPEPWNQLVHQGVELWVGVHGIEQVLVGFAQISTVLPTPAGPTSASTCQAVTTTPGATWKHVPTGARSAGSTRPRNASNAAPTPDGQPPTTTTPRPTHQPTNSPNTGKDPSQSRIGASRGKHK